MTVETVTEPSHREALELVTGAIGSGGVITIAGRCTVEYDGRASSSLGLGDRLVILKPDGSLLVHTDEQRTPVNWQPPGCTHEASLSEDTLRIVSTRSNPTERVDIQFERVLQVSVYDFVDEEDLALAGTEADLREYIFEHPEVIEVDLRPQTRERETPAGPVDIWGLDAQGRPVILELKRRRVGPAAVSQLRRYVESVDEPVRGILVAPSITDRAKELLAEYDLELRTLTPPEEPPETNRTLNEFTDES